MNSKGSKGGKLATSATIGSGICSCLSAAAMPMDVSSGILCPPMAIIVSHAPPPRWYRRPGGICVEDPGWRLYSDGTGFSPSLVEEIQGRPRHLPPTICQMRSRLCVGGDRPARLVRTSCKLGLITVPVRQWRAREPGTEPVSKWKNRRGPKAGGDSPSHARRYPLIVLGCQQAANNLVI